MDGFDGEVLIVHNANVGTTLCPECKTASKKACEHVVIDDRGDLKYFNPQKVCNTAVLVLTEIPPGTLIYDVSTGKSLKRTGKDFAVDICPGDAAVLLCRRPGKLCQAPSAIYPRVEMKHAPQIAAPEKLAQWLSQLVQIPSVTPAQAGKRAGVCGEQRLATKVARWCKSFGATVCVEDVLPDRPSVYAIWRNKQSRRWLALDVHLDTVGVESMQGDPFSGRIQSGRVHGRGSVDTKASLAVALAMLEALKQRGQKLPCNLLLAATADEEATATGAPALAKWIRRQKLQIDEMIVAEPTMCAPVYGHKGVVRMAFALKGRAAHSSNPSSGRNSIHAAAKLVLAMEKEAARLGQIKTALGNPTLSVTLIDGGSGVNIVPDNCVLTIDRRVVPDERSPQIAQALGELARQSSSLPLTSTASILIDAFYNSPESMFIKQLSDWSGKPPCVVPFCTNAWAYSKTAKHCAVLGPGSIAQAHGDVEWVEIPQLQKLQAIYARWWGIA